MYISDTNDFLINYKAWSIYQRKVGWLRWMLSPSDVFAIWLHSKESLMVFLNEINSFQSTIKFTAEWSQESVTFLDTKVFHEGSCLVRHLYTKPMDTHQYLHQCSCHSTHCKTSVALSQALRLRRICARTEDYEQRVGKFKTFLEMRGYNGEEVLRQINRAMECDREGPVNTSN